jgi:enamine deaminase RidA (YjgF/YER057c/UK114 family)
VQSLSEWAPPCIGPYSQGVALGGLLYMAGQISLDPPSLTIVGGGLGAETVQALRNCEAAAVALSTSMRKVIPCRRRPGGLPLFRPDPFLHRSGRYRAELI